MEQRSLEESLNQLMEEVTANTKALQILDSQLLERLSNSTSNLLDDTELIEVLGNTKAKAKEVEKKLKDAKEKRTEGWVRRQRGFAGLDEKAERPCPYKWLGQDSKTWLNVLQLSRHSFGKEKLQFFCELPEALGKNELQWKRWLEDNEPEKQSIPDFEERLRMQKPLGPFIRLCLLRGLREDRTVVASARCIESLLHPRYTEPVTDSIDSIFQESDSRVPVLFLLSPGTDPTSIIDELAKKKKKFPTDKVSMGEGQEIVAREKIRSGFLSGGWVVLQNCHLGLSFMAEIEDLLLKVQDIAKDFRLWITCESHDRFPIGLMQMAIKATNEPPIGLRAGLHRTFTTMISSETLDKVDHEKWRLIVYATAFLHSVVQERRKFGPLGWCVPYEFNYSDLEASLFVIEKHLSTTLLVGQPLSWSTICYMVAEVQYGGRVTDDLDREVRRAKEQERKKTDEEQDGSEETKGERDRQRMEDIGADSKNRHRSGRSRREVREARGRKIQPGIKKVEKQEGKGRREKGREGKRKEEKRKGRRGEERKRDMSGVEV
ncbi:UNVERIFIED_CONTAM: hypothetical protein H355_004498 [Colinus virginianus]|nr:hypothetical protein H355_004498 [Colinus virginianus]